MSKGIKNCACRSGCQRNCGCRKRVRLCFFCLCGDSCKNRGCEEGFGNTSIIADMPLDEGPVQESESDEDSESDAESLK